MLLHRGNLQLDNELIISRSYEFLNNHNLQDFSIQYGSLRGRLSTVVMAMYLIKNNLINLMPHYWEEFKPLVNEINNQTNSNIKSSWFNILPTDTRLPEHNHIQSKFRGATYGTFVYYPKLEKNDSPIELLVNDEWVPINAQSGDWLCFDLTCMHRVPINTTEHHRISFAFDV